MFFVFVFVYISCDGRESTVNYWVDFLIICAMTIFGVFIISKSGGLIFNMDHNLPKIENEKTFSYPLDLVLEYESKKVAVKFGERDGICGEFPGTNTM